MVTLGTCWVQAARHTQHAAGKPPGAPSPVPYRPGREGKTEWDQRRAQAPGLVATDAVET